MERSALHRKLKALGVGWNPSESTCRWQRPIHALAWEYFSLSGLLRRMATRFRVADARTGLPKNRACPLIVPPSWPEGDLRGSRRPGQAPQRARTV